MADAKLSALTELATTPANDDEVYIRDVSEAAATESKRITITNLMAAGGAVTKEFFAPTTRGTESAKYGDYVGYLIDLANETAYATFYVPADFSSLTSVVVVIIPKTTATHRFNLVTDYAASGEDYKTHSALVTDQDIACTADVITEIDLSAALASLAAGDYVGVYIWGDGTNTPEALVIGVRFKYS